MDHTESFCEKRQKDSVEYSLGRMQRSPHPSRVLRGIFGVLAVVIGLAIIAWTATTNLLKRLPEHTGFHWWEPFWDGPGPGEYRPVLAVQSPTAQSI
jgi:hypothetical protein